MQQQPRPRDTGPPAQRPGANVLNLIVGLVLVLLGLLFLLFRYVDLGGISTFWPLFVLVPGLAFFLTIVLLGERVAGLAFPGSIITMTGLILLYQSISGHYESWAYAWTLITPTSIGIALIIFGALIHRSSPRTVGVWLVGAGLVLFVVAAAFFELVLNISGRGGWVSGSVVAAVLLILAGLLILAFGGARGRRAR